MTTSQVNTIFEEVSSKYPNVGVNQWISLENIFTFINMNNDKYNMVAPKTKQYYFDTTNEVIYVRFTDGYPIKLQQNESVDSRYVVIVHDNELYKVKIKGGGYPGTYGIFHELIPFSLISGFYN
jgi:hypothetical protein